MLRRGAELLLVTGLLPEAAAAGCTGASADLAPEQCAAWGQFFDGAGGPNWTNFGNSGLGVKDRCSREDPCSCCPARPNCGVRCSEGSIEYM